MVTLPCNKAKFLGLIILKTNIILNLYSAFHHKKVFTNFSPNSAKTYTHA